MPSNSIRTRSSGRGWIGWVIVAFAVVASGFYFAGRSGSDASRYSNDFNVYYHAAREVLGGRDPYQSSLGAWTPYLYPPLLSEVLIPIALLPLRAASYVWFLINSVSLILAARLGSRLLIPKPLPKLADEREGDSQNSIQQATIAIAALIIIFRFALDNFAMGQVNPLVASLVVAHVFLFDRRQKLPSAVALVVAASIKLSPIILIAYHVARRRFKFAVLCLSLFVVVNGLSFAVLGRAASDGFEVFWNRTVRNQQGYDLAYAGNQSLRGVIGRIAGEMAQESRLESTESDNSEGGEGSAKPTDRARHPLSAATVAVSILFLIIAGSAAWRADSEATAAAPFVCLVVLLSPLSWKAHYVGMLLPAALLVEHAIAVRRAGDSGSGRKIRPSLLSSLSVAALLLVFSLWNLTSPNVIGLAAAEWADSHSLVFVGGLLLFLATTMFAFGAVEHGSQEASR